MDGTECRYIVYRYRTLIVQTAMVQSIIVSALISHFLGSCIKQKRKERKGNDDLFMLTPHSPLHPTSLGERDTNQ